MLVNILLDLLASWQGHYGKHCNHMHLEGNWCLLTFLPIYNCEVASTLWKLVFSIVRIQWVMTIGGIDLLASWQGDYGKHCDHMHLEGNFSLPHMVYLEGKERKVF